MVKLILCLLLFVVGTIRSEVFEDVLIDEVENVDEISPLNSTVDKIPSI